MPPKKRNKENRALPARWTWKNGAIYYLVPIADRHNWDNKAWFRLGKTLAEAHRVYSERVHDVGNAKIITVQHLLDRFEFEYLPTKSKSTQKYYLHVLPILRKVFTTNKVPVPAVEPHHAYKMMDYVTREHNEKRAAQCMECLSSAYSQAVRWGVIKANPFIGQVKKPSGSSGGREIKDAELIGFGGTLPRKWQLYISLKLHTKGRRKGELLRLMRSNLTTDGIVFINNKRKSDRFLVPWTPVLREIVTEILKLHPSRIGDAPLFFGRGYKPYINDDGETSGFDSIWQRYMRKWVAAGNQKFREHDIRAKAVEGENLEVASRLLRHTSPAVTKKHYRHKLEQI